MPHRQEARSRSSAESICSWLRPSAAGMALWRSSSLASSLRPVGKASSAGVIATVTRPVGVPAGSCRVRSSLISAVKEKDPIGVVWIHPG